jgi:hypothetical protein
MQPAFNQTRMSNLAAPLPSDSTSRDERTPRHLVKAVETRETCLMLNPSSDALNAAFRTVSEDSQIELGDLCGGREVCEKQYLMRAHR